MERAASGLEGGDEHRLEGPVVSCFRVDPSIRVIRALVMGALVMTAGSVLMALSFAQLGHAPVDLRDPATLTFAFVVGALGLATVVGGGLVAFSGLQRVLEEERYLALQTTGACFRDGDARSVIAWVEVASVRAVGERVLFERHDGTVWSRTERFAGVDAAELARRCAEVRRKALFGLL